MNIQGMIIIIMSSHKQQTNIHRNNLSKAESFTKIINLQVTIKSDFKFKIQYRECESIRGQNLEINYCNI